MSVTTWDAPQPTVTVGSAIDPTKPTETVAYTQDVRDNFAAAKAEIEALQAALGVISVDDNTGDITLRTEAPQSGGTRGIIILDATAYRLMGDPNQGGGSNLQTPGYFWGQTDDAPTSGGFGGMSGAATVKSGDSWFGTGDVTGANTASSGMCGFGTGNITGGGTSGRIEFAVGASDGTSGDFNIIIGNAPTRGSVYVDAPSIQHDTGSYTAIFGPDDSSTPAYGIVAEGFNIKATNAARTGAGAWLISADASSAGTQSAGTGVGTGNAQTGGATGDMWAYSGNVQSGPGNSGTVYLWSGDVVDGRSGDAYVAVGAANGTGTRGNIVLSAPRITTQDGEQFYLAPAPGQDIGMESADTRSLGTDSGALWMGTSDAGAKAGDISIYGGASLGANTKGANVGIWSGDARTGNANGGDITLGVGNGVGTGTRGNIVLDAPNVLLTADPTDPLGAATKQYVDTKVIAVSVGDYGAKSDGVTDDTAFVNAAIAAVYAKGGGAVVFPAGTTLMLGPMLIPNSGTTNNPTQNPIRLTGALGSPDSYLGNSVHGPSTPTGGTVLDLRYGATPDGVHIAKIDTRGAGILEIDHLALTDGGSSDYQFIFTTNTTLNIHDMVFRGNSAKSGTACVQNAIRLGGDTTALATNAATAGFQGYGSRIKDCHFSNIRVAVGFGSAANAVYCDNLTTDVSCGSSDPQGAPFVFYGTGYGASGCTIHAGIVEMANYRYGAAFLGTANNVLNCIIAQGLYDEKMGNPTVGGYYFSASSTINTIIPGFVDSPIQAVLTNGPGASVNTVVNGGGASSFPWTTAFGQGTTQALVILNGGNTSNNDGPILSLRAAGTTIGAIGAYSAVMGGAYQNNVTLYGGGHNILIPGDGLGVRSGNAISYGVIQAGDGTGQRSIAAVGGSTAAGDGAGFRVYNGAGWNGFFGNEDVYLGGAYTQRMVLAGYAGITFSSQGAAKNRLDNNGDYYDLTVAKATPTTGQTVTIANGVQTQLIVPAGTLAALTVTLGNAGLNGMIKRFSVSQAITALTVNASPGTVSNPPTSAVAGQSFAFISYGPDNMWYPIKG